MDVKKSLGDLTGNWIGTNKLRVMPTDPYGESAATATITTAANGCLTTIVYTWADGDTPQDGFLAITSGQDPHEAVAVWVDTWHQSPQWMNLSGTISDTGVISLRGTYGAEDDRGGWRIHIHPIDATTVRITMDNIYTDLDYQVVEANYSRSASY